MYHDLYLGGKALVERENVGFDLTNSYLYPSFVKVLTAKSVGLHVADSHTGNHCENDFMPLETIRRFLGIIRSRSLSSSKERPLSQRGGPYCVLPRTQGCVLVLRFVSCVLALCFGSAFCLIEDLIAFCLGEALPNSKPRCVLSQSLRFVSKLIAFCLK
nr:hypothetical protein [Tanacetum cinerariifolium]